jgi:hypothetical protein
LSAALGSWHHNGPFGNGFKAHVEDI